MASTASAYTGSHKPAFRSAESILLLLLKNTSSMSPTNTDIMDIDTYVQPDQKISRPPTTNAIGDRSFAAGSVYGLFSPAWVFLNTRRDTADGAYEKTTASTKTLRTDAKDGSSTR